jgi:hypothetical protein
VTATQQAALARGRKRYQAEQRREAIARVIAYERWLKAGSDFGKLAGLEIPSDSDYRIARAAGKMTR